jgi:NitT/TauT family transport system substrate-binding protein
LFGIIIIMLPRRLTAMVLGQPKKSESITSTRRQFLGVAGGAAIAGTAGCLGGEGISEVAIGYKPIFPYIQSLVMESEGYYEEVDATVETENFGNTGLTIMQSFASGDLDVAFVGITPAIRMHDRGMPSAVTAANNRNGFLFLAHEEFASTWQSEPPETAFEQFRDRTGSPFRFAAPPESSVATVLLHHWREDVLGLTPDLFEIKAFGGAGPVRQALVTGEADGACIMEPIPTMLAAQDAPFEQIAWAGDFMDGQPGGVMVMHDRLRESDVASALLDQHVRATEFVESNPDAAAEIVSEAVGSEQLPTEAARQALDSPGANFVSDPRMVADDTPVFCETMAELGLTDSRVDAGDLFDYGPYDDR